MVEILTRRLRLTPLSAWDLDALREMYADPDVMLGSSGVAVARTHQETAEWLHRTLTTSSPRSGHETFRVEDSRSGLFLGRCGLRPDRDSFTTELAYAFVRQAWGRGIATESALATVRWGFAGGLTEVTSCALADNLASRRVLEKIGMRRVGEASTQTGALIRYEARSEPGQPRDD